MLFFFFAGVIMLMLGMSVCGTSVYNLIPVLLMELCGADSITTGIGSQVFMQSFENIVSSFIAGE